MYYEAQFRSNDSLEHSTGTIVAVDPGEHVGVAVARWYNLRQRSTGNEYLYQLNIATYMRKWEDESTVRWLAKQIKVADVLAYEGFNLFPSKAVAQVGSRFPTVECVGWIKGCAIVGNLLWHAYHPASVSAISDESLEYWLDTADDLPNTTHERSALRVLLTYLRKDLEEDWIDERHT